jgi:threonine/homoserine/homoserine lactone efflux protein
MLPTGHLVAFFVTIVVVIAIPGPSVLFTVGRALTVGRRGALLTVVGNGFGIYAQAVLVAVGLGAIVERSATAYTAIKVAGALYLVYLGLHAIVTRRQAAARIWVGTAPKSTVRVLLEGFVVGVTNPKMIIFLTAAMPQFVDREAGNVAGQILVLSLVLVAVGCVLDATWALAAGTARNWFARSPRRVETMSATGGTAMIGLGASFLLLGHDTT